MNSCIHQLIEFLSERQYDHVLSPKILKGPSKKDFSNIIQFLVRQIDPNFEFSGKFEDDVATLFKILKYPFAISKTALVAVGSPHTWPALLGSIAWIIELLSYDEEVQQANGVEDFDGENGDKAFFDFLGNAYRSFLAGDDEHYNALEQQLAHKIDSRNQTIRDECADMERANEDLRRRIEQAKNGKSSLPTLNSKKSDYLSDLEKFKKLISQLEAHKASIQRKIHEREEEYAKKEHELVLRNQEIEKLNVRIQNQELSAEDVEHMAKERARLQEQIQQVTQRQKDVQSNIYHQESHIAQQMDKLEELAQLYSATATRMKLVPSMAKNAHGVDYEIELDAHTGGVQVAQELSAHLKRHVRPALTAFKKNRIERVNLALDEALELQADVEKSEEIVKAETQKAQKIDSKLRKLEETYRREQESLDADTEYQLSQTEEVEMRIESLLNERDISAESMQSRQQLEQARKDYNTMKEKYEHLVQKNRHELANVLVSCTDHKEMIERQISSLESDVQSFWS